MALRSPFAFADPAFLPVRTAAMRQRSEASVTARRLVITRFA
jgi:hypothetical protein